jgi:hypothetical protein
LAYRLRRLVGFAPPLAVEIGYGRAVHHVLRHVAETVRGTTRVPSADELDEIFDAAVPAPRIAAVRLARVVLGPVGAGAQWTSRPEKVMDRGTWQTK